MIYTVTFNPSLDYIVTVDQFELGKTNRTVWASKIQPLDFWPDLPVKKLNGESARAAYPAASFSLKMAVPESI